jgi:hypothetical protein
MEYTVNAVLAGMAILTLAFTVVSFAAVMATYNSDKVRNRCRLLHVS